MCVDIYSMNGLLILKNFNCLHKSSVDDSMQVFNLGKN
jgi:hypothetical protein